MRIELSELNRLRIERDLTYDKMAREIGITPQNLYRLLNTPNPNLFDRTLYRIRKYLRRQGVNLEAA